MVEDTPYLRASKYAETYAHYQAEDYSLSECELDYLSNLNCWRYFDQHNNIPWTGGPNIVKERKEREKAGRNKTPTQSTTTISAASAQTFGTTENRVAKHKPDNDFDPQPHPSFRTVQREDEMPVRYAESRITFLESKLHFLQFLESRMPLLESKIQSLENRAKKAEACDKASAIRINKLEQQVAQLKGKFTGIKKALQSRSHAR